MTHPAGNSTRALAVAGLLGALALAVPPAAGAATVQSYTCADSAQSGATSASLSLTSPPASVPAGQTLTLQAKLTLTLPVSFDLAATVDLISQVGLSTTTFGLQVQIGGTVEVVPAAIVIGQLQTVTVGSSEVASAALTFPAVTVPRTATGDVVLSMPTAAQYPNSATSTPAEVVFNGVLEEQTYTATPSSSNLACYDASSSPTSQVVAQIPIQAAAAATKAATATKTTASTPAKTTSAGTTSATTKSRKSATSAQSSHSASASPPTSAPSTGSAAVASQSAAAVAAAGPPAASTASASTAASTPSTSSAAAPTSASSSSGTDSPATTGTPVSVTIPPRTVGSGTFIPTWELILMGSVVPIAALAYAWRMRQKLALARTNLEHRQTSVTGESPTRT